MMNCYRQIFINKIKEVNKSQWYSNIFKLSSFGLNTWTETSAPLVNGVNNALFHSVPHVNQTLPQIVHVLHFRLVDSLLHQAQDFVVSWIKVGLFGSHKSGEMKAGVLHSRLSLETTALEHYPAEIWRTRRRCDVCPAAYMLLQQNVALVGYIHFDSRLDNYQTSVAQFWHTDRHHQRLAECGLRVKQTFRCNVFFPDGSRNVQSVILWVLRCSRHISDEFFIFQQDSALLINIAWVRIP